MGYSEQVKRDMGIAANILRTEGWCQGTPHGADGGHCALGAIWNACRVGHVEGGEFLPESESFAMEFAVTEAIGGGSIAVWNDAPGRTKEEVLAVFDQIANS